MEIHAIIREYMKAKEEAKESGKEVAVKIVEYPEDNQDEQLKTFARNLQLNAKNAQGTQKLVYLKIMEDFKRIFKS